jgi:hypothetical protein
VLQLDSSVDGVSVDGDRGPPGGEKAEGTKVPGLPECAFELPPLSGGLQSISRSYLHHYGEQFQRRSTPTLWYLPAARDTLDIPMIPSPRDAVAIPSCGLPGRSGGLPRIACGAEWTGGGSGGKRVGRREETRVLPRSPVFSASTVQCIRPPSSVVKDGRVTRELVLPLKSRNYKVSATVGVTTVVARPVRAILNTESGPNLVRAELPPQDWERYRVTSDPPREIV